MLTLQEGAILEFKKFFVFKKMGAFKMGRDAIPVSQSNVPDMGLPIFITCM